MTISFQKSLFPMICKTELFFLPFSFILVKKIRNQKPTTYFTLKIEK